MVLNHKKKRKKLKTLKKLLWLNKHYINNLSLNHISNLLKDYMKNQNINIKNGPDLESVVKILRSRFNTLKEITESCRYFYEEFDVFNKIAVEKHFTIKSVYILEEFYERMKKLSVWDNYNILTMINDISKDVKVTKKEVNMVLRISMTGNMHSPSISSIIDLIGRERVLSRIKKAINYIKNL